MKSQKTGFKQCLWYQVIFTNCLAVFIFMIPYRIFAQTTSYKDTIFTEYFRQTGPGWVASDGTLSLPLPDGRVLWFMGDSYIDDYRASDTSVPCLFQIRNTILVQDASDRSKFVTIIDSTKTGVNRTPVKIKDNDNLFWPGNGYVKGDTAYTFWNQYNNNTLALLGVYLVKMYWPTFTNASSIVSFTRLDALGTTDFGTSVYVDSAANYVYIYGSKPDWIVHQPYVARCSFDNILGTWEFYNGTDWTTDINKAAKILEPVSGEYVSANYSVIKIQSKYYLISQDIGYLVCGYGRKVFAWSGDTPYGPFGNRQLIYVIDDMYKGKYMITYNGQVHRGFTENNEILWSYNVNNICPTECNNGRYNADLYRPKFIRVPFAVLDTGIFFKPEASFSVDPGTQVKTSATVKFDPSLSIAKGNISTYNWDFGDGISTSTNPFAKIATHSYSEEGDYNVKLTIIDDETGLTDDTTMTVTVSKAVGIDNESFPGVEIFPNPGSGRFLVSFPDYINHPQSEILVTNLMGQIVTRKQIAGSETVFYLHAPVGLYSVQIIDGDERGVYKLVVEE